MGEQEKCQTQSENLHVVNHPKAAAHTLKCLLIFSCRPVSDAQLIVVGECGGHI